MNHGESKTVQFIVHTDDLRFWNDNMEYVVEPGQFRLWIAGSSDGGLMTEFEIVK